MQKQHDFSDESLLSAFQASELSGEIFTHEAHIRVCWLLLKKYPLLKALQLMTQGLKALVTKLGAADKYHETLSVALALLMYERMRNGEDRFADFLQNNPDLLTNWRDLLSDYYSGEQLWSAEAKQHFVLGD